MGQRKHKKRKEVSTEKIVEGISTMISSAILNSAVKLRGTDLDTDLVEINCTPFIPKEVLEAVQAECRKVGISSENEKTIISSFITRLIATGYMGELYKLTSTLEQKGDQKCH